MLAELISALTDEHAYLKLLSKYKKLLMKYARMLNYEDSYEDLQVFFLALVSKMSDNPVLTKGDGAIVNYIVSSIKHQYIALSKRNTHKSELLFSELSDAQLAFVENLSSGIDETDISDLYPVKFDLSEKKRL